MSEFVMGSRLVLRDQFSAPMSKATEQSEKFGKTVRVNSACFEGGARSAGKFTGSLKEIGGAFKLIMASAAFLTIKKYFIDANSEMQRYKMTLTAIYGGNKKLANDTLKWSEKFAADTPFEIPQIVEATTRLQSYGMTAKKSLGVIGDMASVMGKDLMSAVEAVADAQTGELERFKEFGITKNQIAAQAKLMKISVINSKGQITDQKAFNAAMFALMEKRFKGGMKLQSQTFDGMMSNVKDFMGKIGRTLGGPIFSALNRGLKQVLAQFDRLEKNGTIKAWIKTIMSLLGEIWRGLQPVAMAFLWLAGIVLRAADAVVKWAGKSKFVKAWLFVASRLVGIILGVIVVVKILSGVTAILNAVLYANPIILIILAIVTLITIGYLLVTNWKTIAKWFGGIWETIKNAVVKGWTAMVNWIKMAIQKIGAFFKKWGVTILLAIFAPWALGLLFIVKHWRQISSFLQGVWRNIASAAGRLWAAIVAAVKKAVLSALRTAVGLRTAVINTLKSVWRHLTQWIGNAIKNAFNWGRKLMQTFSKGISSGWRWMKGALTSSFNKARKFMPHSDAKEGPFSDLTTSGRKLMSTMAAGVKMGQGSLHTAMRSAFNGAPKLQTATIGGGINPGGSPAGRSGGKQVSIGQLVGEVHLHDVGQKDTKQLIDELISGLHDRLKNAGDVVAGGEMGAVL